LKFISIPLLNSFLKLGAGELSRLRAHTSHKLTGGPEPKAIMCVRDEPWRDDGKLQWV